MSKNYSCCKKSKCHIEYDFDQNQCDDKPKIFDYIIIGAGTAGCLIAKNLSQSNRGNSRTLVIEAGPNLNREPLITLPFIPSTDRPGINLVNATDDPIDSYTFTSITTAFDVPSPANPTINKDNRVSFRVGRAVGGGSAKNLLLTVVGSPEYYNDVATNYTNSGWDDFRDINQAIETYIGLENPISNDCRGENGAIKVTQAAAPPPNNVNPEFPAKMANLAGVPFVVDYNDCINTCAFSRNQQFVKSVNNQTLRSFSGNEYLGDNVVNQITGKGIGIWKKLRLLTKTTVLKILFDNTHKCKHPIANGVLVLENGETKTYHAKRIILAGGAVHNPAILQRSGIGPLDVLTKAHIKPVLVNENVGKNFIDHFGPPVVIQVAKSAIPNLTTGWGAFLPITVQGLVIGGTRRNVQFVSLNGTNSISPAFQPALDLDTINFNYFSLLCWNLRPESRGTINIASNDPLMFPRIDANFYQTNGQLNDDIKVAQNSIFFLKAVVDALNVDHGSEVYKIVYPTTEDIDPLNPNLLNQYIGGEISVTDHPTGTCKMDSNNVATSVVDDRLKVRGIDNLYCADLSILPIIPDGNTCFGAYHVGGQFVEFQTGIQFNNVNPF